MQILVVVLIVVSALFSFAHGQSAEIKPGQTWSTNAPSAPNLRVFIGKIDDETNDILHIGLSGLPDLKRDPSILEELSLGKPVAKTHLSCESCLSNIQNDFYFSFDMAPNFTRNAVTLKVLYLPIDRAVLVPDLNSVVESNVIATPSFESGWSNWDYLRDTYGLEYETSRIAKQPLAEVIKVVSRAAKGHLKFLEENKNELGPIDEKVRFKVTVEPVEAQSDNN